MPAPSSPFQPERPKSASRRASRLVRLTQATNLCGRGLRRALHGQTRELGLSDADLLALWACACGAERGVAQNQLVEEIGLSAAQTSGLLDRLKQRGLVASRRPAQDRRRQFWRLEPPGRELLADALARIGALAERVLNPLSHDEQESLERLLDLVGHSTQEPAAPEASQRHPGPDPELPGRSTNQRIVGTESQPANCRDGVPTYELPEGIGAPHAGEAA
jgi:DNA-binding MarR family transcriptional regulator